MADAYLKVKDGPQGLSLVREEADTTVNELKEAVDTLNNGGLVLKDEVIQEAVAENVEDWLDSHPEATTTVEDESLAYNKLIPGTLGYFTPEMFGAKSDGVTDDTQAIIDAFEACKTYGKYLVCPGKHYKTTANCVLSFGAYDFNVYVLGEIDIVEFVGSPTRGNAVAIEVSEVTTITFKDFKGLSAFVNHAVTLNVFASTANGCAYNNFRGALAVNIVLQGLISGAWVNENKFYDFRVTNLSIIGNNYNHNNNRFYDIDLEGGTLTLDGANSNYFQIRGESGFSKSFQNQRNNIIERTYLTAMANVPEPVYDDRFSFTVFSQHKYLSLTELFRLDKTNMKLVDDKNIQIPKNITFVTLLIRMMAPMSIAVNASSNFRFNFSIFDSTFNNITTSAADTCGAVAAGATYRDTGDNPRWGVSSDNPTALINVYDGNRTHWLRLSFVTGPNAFVAPDFAVYLKSLFAPDFFVQSSILDNFPKSGASSGRPAISGVDTGYTYFDTTLGKLIVSNGSDWVNADGTALA